MREILFRAKAKDDGMWIEGFPDRIYDYGGLVWNMHPFNTNIEITRSIEPKTIGQFTGLADKNGKKIFEGDIVVCRKEINGNWIDYCVEIGFVEMKHGAFGLHRKQGYYRPFKDWLEDYEYEVIGNIHDNPELLEVQP